MSSVQTQSQQTAPSDKEVFDVGGRAAAEQEEEVHPNVSSTGLSSTAHCVWTSCSEHLNIKQEEWETPAGEQHCANRAEASCPVEDGAAKLEFYWMPSVGSIKEEPSSCSVDDLIKTEQPEGATDTEENESDSSETDVSDDWQDADSDHGNGQQQSKICSHRKIAVTGRNAIGKKFPTENSFPTNPAQQSEEPPSKKSDTSKRGKPYSCGVCSKYFSNITYLKSHMRSHTGEKPFCCYVCGQSFTYGSNLNRHMSVHAFRCNVCRKRSLTNLSLRVDTGKKSVSCDVCRKKFKQSVESRKHFRVQEFLKNIFTEISDEDETLE